MLEQLCQILLKASPIESEVVLILTLGGLLLNMTEFVVELLHVSSHVSHCIDFNTHITQFPSLHMPVKRFYS